MEKCHARGGIFQSCAASLVSLRGNETLRVLPGGAVMHGAPTSLARLAHFNWEWPVCLECKRHLVHSSQFVICCGWWPSCVARFCLNDGRTQHSTRRLATAKTGT